MSGPGRNAPCPCGSGKKTKKCCGTLVAKLPFVEPWKLKAIEVFARQPDFMPPMSDEERRAWVEFDCPHTDDACPHHTDYEDGRIGGCAAMCGV